jgi:hypothetical protein
VKQVTPKIDPRSAPDIFKQVVELLHRTKADLKADADWDAFQPELGTSKALIKIFARFAELITDRLNRVPEKNFLAFLDLLGASLLPPRSARVPLTFSLAEAATSAAIVRAGTKVAAKATEGEQEPAVFETERELVVTAAKLAAVFFRNPATDRYANQASLLPQSGESRSQEVIFQSDSSIEQTLYPPIEHILYIAHDRIFNHPGKRTNFTVRLRLSGDNLTVAWEDWDEEKQQWVEKQRGKLADDNLVDLKSLNPSPPMVINGTQKRWLRCRLIGAILSPETLPTISALILNATFERKDRALESAFTNGFPVDTNRGFYPFGESPKPGDAFYLRLDKDFAEAGGKITLNVTLSMVGQDPASGKPRDARVVWQFWNGSAWVAIARKEVKEGKDKAAGIQVEDATANLTVSNLVQFPFREDSMITSVNGVEGHWVRARLDSGSYGPGAELIAENIGNKYTYRSIPAAAPLISSIVTSYETILAEEPETVLAYNDFIYQDRERLTDKTKFVPFHASGDDKPAFYLGFEPPTRLSPMPNSKFNLFIQTIGEANPNARPELEWQYSTGTDKNQWTKLTVLDATTDFIRSGVIEFFAPPDFAPRCEFGATLYWLRAVLKNGTYTIAPVVSCVLLNTVMARHATRIEAEVLGSSDGNKNQTFRTALAPVLEGQRLEVRELEAPSPLEQDLIKKDAGEDAILILADQAGRLLETWVRWMQVPDFYGSGPHDRHYVLDHLTGTVRFGDGTSGMIPLIANNNIRMGSYRSGGGLQGNKPAGTITELRTTVPYIESVTNHIAASGGAEAETPDALLERMPRTIRHGGRAVTYEDYEDLALLASPETARARCVRFYGVNENQKDASGTGKVLLIVVPYSAEPQPVPSLELKRRVQEYIDERKSPLVQLTVAEPKYIKVRVTVNVAPISLEVASEVKIAVLERLNRFLHPLVGGFEGTGWGFGRMPHDSDFYYLIEAIPGVDHVNKLQMEREKDGGMGTEPLVKGTVMESEQHLIASGKHIVNCEF